MNTAANRYFRGKTAEEIYDIYEILATNSQQNTIIDPRANVRKVNTSNPNDFGA